MPRNLVPATDLASPAPVARLRRVAAALAAASSVDAEDASWLAEGLGRYLEEARAGLTLEQALDLTTPWWRAETLTARDAILRQLAAGFTGPGTTRASQLAHLLRRYAGAGWHHDRRRGQPTAEGQQRRLLFDLFRLDPDPPLSVRRLYDIVTARDAVSAPCSLHTETGILGSVVETVSDAHGVS